MNISRIASALGKMGKGKRKTMSEAAIAQRRTAAKKSATARKILQKNKCNLANESDLQQTSVRPK